MNDKLDIVFCADDFTGASDTLATLTRCGRRARLYLRAPNAEEVNDLDAIGVATSLRAMPAHDAQASMTRIAEELSALPAPIYHFKVCSTFDSSPNVGNIVTAVEAYAKQIQPDLIVIIGGQPSLGRYCVFGTLFAASAQGSVDRIDRHPVMRIHPVTPMHEADLRCHLGNQGWSNIGLIDITRCREGEENLLTLLETHRRQRNDPVLIDVLADEDLTRTGLALRQLSNHCRILCIGASSVIEALFNAAPKDAIPSAKRDLPPITQPVLVIAGSRSRVTADQISAATRYQRFSVSPTTLCDPANHLDLIQRCQKSLRQGNSTILQVTSDTDHGFSSAEISQALSHCLHGILNTAHHVGCLVIAGGDTSSTAVQALNVDSLDMIADLQPGVPLLRFHSRNPQIDGIPVVLKGGQMGSTELLNEILVRLQVQRQ